MTEAEAWDLLIKALGLFGGLGAIMVAAAGFLSKFMADRSIERHKAELGQETERLKSELSQETETHKFQLKKKEILFTKQIDAAAAYFDLYKSWSPATPIPEKDWHDVLTETVEEFGDMETRLNVYLSVHGVFLS